MRIAYLAEARLPSRQANSIQVMRMCGAFALNGHQVGLYVPNHGETQAADRERLFSFYGAEPAFDVHRLACPPVRGQATLMAMHGAWLVRRGDPDLIYTRTLTLGERVSRWAGRPIVLELHAPVADPLRERFVALIGRRAFRHLVVISQALADALLQDHPQLQGRIVVAHDAADVPPADARSIALKRDGRLVAGYCGQLFKGKGMEIVAGLARAMPDIDFHVVGGEDTDLAFWKSETLGLANLTFHGPQPPARVPAYIAAFDVALAPYQRRVEGFGGGRDIASWMSPLKIFEYMACGKAIVSSDLPVLREVLGDGRNARLCDPDDLESWIQVMRSLQDDGARSRLAGTARRDFVTHHTWAQRAAKVLAAPGTAVL